jgi:NAD-dependent deacetylase
MNSRDITKVKAVLENARRVFVLTGAGVSAESGVPTFRGGGGASVWRGMPFEELSSARMVKENLPLVWEWFDYRRDLVGKCEPNAAHLAIAELQQSGKFEEFALVTQNIDRLHAKTGSTGIIELHGNLWRARCLSCDKRSEISEALVEERPPRCAECGAAMRPDVVLFGEFLPEGAFEKALDYAKTCDICLVVGTSALVYPAAFLPEAAQAAGAFLVEVNPEETSFTNRCDVSLRGRAGEILPQLLS